MAESVRDTKALLTIKVLRLVRPSLIGPLALAGDSRDLPGDLLEKELNCDITAVPGVEFLSLGKFLRLPQGFGNMYLGETFSSYVCIQNESPVLIKNVSCKVELQTNSQKFLLSDDKFMSEMKTGATIDVVMNHEVKEMGKHMLICTLNYTLTNQVEPITMERFFRFQVKKPLDVKTKLYNAENDEVFLEAQVQNITSGAICLEKISLDPSAFFNSMLMTASVEDQKSLRRSNVPFQPFTQNIILDTDNSHQFLYRLTPKADNARSATNIGKLDIVWRTSQGDKGRLQTSQLQRQPPVLNDLKLVMEKIPGTCEVDTPFEAVCKLINTTSDRQMDLQLELEESPTKLSANFSNDSESTDTDVYEWLGVTRTKLGILPPSSSLPLNLTIYPIRTGVIHISGVCIIDLASGKKFPFNDIAQVLIMNHNYEPS